MKRLLPVLFVAIFALVGLIDSSLIHLKEIKALTDPQAFASCSLSAVINCATVAQSSYSHVLGIPVSQVGIYFYEALLVVALAILHGWVISRWIAWVITLVCAVSVSFSYYLLYMSWFGVGALCPYCVVSNLSTSFATVSWLVYAWPLLKTRKS